MTKQIIFLSLLVSLVSPAYARFLPVDRTEPASQGVRDNGMTQAQYLDVMAKVSAAYAPVAKEFGGHLAISGKWDSQALNAGSTEFLGHWAVDISGAIARRPEMTTDGLTLVVCHEVGHHLGGFPFAQAESPLSGTWAANEGQADYFSTHLCARKVWDHDDTLNATFESQVSDYGHQECDGTLSAQHDRDLCYRTLVAIDSMTRTMASIMQKPAPSFQTPSATAVAATSDAHPDVQCRMDTVFAGALCTQTWDEKIIPGDKTAGGKFSLAAEQQAAQSSCTTSGGFRFGLRPACWYKARL